jgi:hypothetical protein
MSAGAAAGAPSPMGMLVQGMRSLHTHPGQQAEHQPPAGAPPPPYPGAAGAPNPDQQAAFQQALFIQQQQQARFQGLLAAQNQSFATTAGILQQQNAATMNMNHMYMNQANSMVQASADQRMHNLAQRTQHNQDFINAINGVDTIRYTWQGPASGPYPGFR